LGVGSTPWQARGPVDCGPARCGRWGTRRRRRGRTQQHGLVHAATATPPPIGLRSQPPDWPASRTGDPPAQEATANPALAKPPCPWQQPFFVGVGVWACRPCPPCAGCRWSRCTCGGRASLLGFGFGRRAGDDGLLGGRLVYAAAAPAVRAVPSRKGGGGPRHARPRLQQALPTPDCGTLLSASSCTCSMTVDTVGGVRG